MTPAPNFQAQQNGSYPVPDSIAAQTHADAATYQALYAQSVSDPEAFWREQGRRLDWIKPYSTVKNTNFQIPDVSIKWFEDGTLNVAANCIDRHLATRGDQTAIIWEADDPATPAQHITYRELHDQVCRLANVFKAQGVGKGDRVVIYLPMIPAGRLCHAGLRAHRGHSLDRLCRFLARCPGQSRINGCDAKLVITADFAPRGGREDAA